jgi:hypothetical protein
MTMTCELETMRIEQVEPVRYATRRSHRGVGVVLVLILLSIICPRAAAQATQTQVAPTKEELIKQLENYYVEMYSEPLRAKGRLPKLLAIMSLSQIQAERTSSAIVELLANKDPVVRYLAWEVLHTRHTSLTPEQRLFWAKEGAAMAGKGDFPGATLAAPLKVMAGMPREEFDRDANKILGRVLKDYSPEKKQDLPVLDAARAWIGAWRSPALVGEAKSKIKDGSNAAWYLLEPLAKKAVTDGPLESTSERRAAVDKWLRSDDAKYDPTQIVAYTTLGQLVPAGKVITDPNADEFRAELEIGKLNVDSIDVCWVIDATGSMYGPNQIIAGQTARFAAALSVLSDRVRFGAAYYRHELDPKLQQPCCGPAGQRPFYQVKVHPLTSNIPEIVRTMANEPIPKPDPKLHRNTHPGCAVAGGIAGSVKAGMWVDAGKGKRVMILVGDSHLTPGTEAATSDLIKQVTERDFIVHSLLLGPAVRLWPEHIKTSGNEPQKLWKIVSPDAPDKPSNEAIWAFRSLERVVILSTVSKNFHGRIDPLLKALRPYIDGVAGE